MLECGELVEVPISLEKISEKQAAQLLGVSKKTFRNWRYRGYGPPFRKIGGKVIYRACDIRAWLDSQVRLPGAK